MRTPTPYRIAHLAAACGALMAGTAAHAVDWTGYMRGGPAATTVSGESRQCYGLNGPGLKYRLGNECDFYGEFQLAQAVKADGVDFNAVLMTNYYSPQTESNSNYGIEQAYVEMKGVDIAPQALFWMGKRRDRDDVHIVDTFFVNMSGVGAGVENIDLGFGKFGFAGYKTDSQPVRNGDGSLNQFAGNNGGARLHAQLYDIGVNPDGKLRVVGTYSKSDSQGGIKGTDGFGLSVEHVQDKFFGGGNHIWLQYAQGATNINQGFGDLTAPTGNKTWRIVESPSWQIGAFGGQAIALYQHDQTDGGVQHEVVLARRPRLVRDHQEPEVPDRNRLLEQEARRRRVREPDQDHDRPGPVDRPGLLEAPGTAPVRDLRRLQQGGRAGREQRPADQQDQRRVLRRPGRGVVLTAYFDGLEPRHDAHTRSPAPRR